MQKEEALMNDKNLSHTVFNSLLAIVYETGTGLLQSPTTRPPTVGPVPLQEVSAVVHATRIDDLLQGRVSDPGKGC